MKRNSDPFIIGISGAIVLFIIGAFATWFIVSTAKPSVCQQWVTVVNVVDVQSGYIHFTDPLGQTHATNLPTVKPGTQVCLRWSS